MPIRKDTPENIAFMRREAARRQREREAAFASFRRIAVAFVNALDGSIDVPGNPGYVWVSTWGIAGSRYAAYNKGFSLVDQTPVLVAYAPQEPFRWEIIDLYDSDIAPQNGGSPTTFRLPLHAKNHQYPSEENPGKDPVTVFQPALDMFKGFVFSGMKVGVRPGIYQYLNTIYNYLGTATINLTGYIPTTASFQKYVLVYVDRPTNLAGVVDSAEAAIATKPEVPPGGIASAYWFLEEGMTELTMTGNYTDARPTAGTGSAAVFDVNTIMTDANGGIMVDANGNVMVST